MTDKGIALGQGIRESMAAAGVARHAALAPLAATPPPYPRERLPLGSDQSFYQGVVSYQGAWDDGVRWSAIRGGQRHGLSGWTDSRFVENWKNAKAAGILRQMYWVWDPTATGQQHLDGMKRAFDLVDGDLGELPPVPDIELFPIHWNQIEVWCRGLDDLYGKLPIPYSGAWVLNQVTVPQFFRVLPIWLTGYNNIGPDYPRDYTPNVVAWQQTSSWVVPWVQSASVDRDYWLTDGKLDLWRYANMTDKVIDVDALLDFMAQNQRECEQPTEPQPPTLDEYEVLAASNLRTAPNVSNTPIRLIGAGEHVFDLGGRTADWWFVRDQNNVDGWLWTNNGNKVSKV